MFFRAWGRTVALLFRRPEALLLPNLTASLALGALILVFAAAAALEAPQAVLSALKLCAALWFWMLLSWLAFSARQSWEGTPGGFGPRALAAWLRRRAAERSLSFALLLAGAFWTGLAINFYRAASLSYALAAGALLVSALVAALLGMAVMLNLALASRPSPEPKAEWRASLLMVLAFPAPSMAALASVLFLSGGLAFLAGPAHWWGRLLWVPTLCLPVFGAAFAAAFLVALSDEFLARSHGQEPPAYEPFRFKELIRPWH